MCYAFQNWLQTKNIKFILRGRFCVLLFLFGEKKYSLENINHVEFYAQHNSRLPHFVHPVLTWNPKQKCDWLSTYREFTRLCSDVQSIQLGYNINITHMMGDSAKHKLALHCVCKLFHYNGKHNGLKQLKTHFVYSWTFCKDDSSQIKENCWYSKVPAEPVGTPRYTM